MQSTSVILQLGFVFTKKGALDAPPSAFDEFCIMVAMPNDSRLYII